MTVGATGDGESQRATRVRRLYQATVMRNIRWRPEFTLVRWKRDAMRCPQRSRQQSQKKGKGRDMAKDTVFNSRVGVSTLAAGLLVALVGVLLGPAHVTQAALVDGGHGPQLLI